MPQSNELLIGMQHCTWTIDCTSSIQAMRGADDDVGQKISCTLIVPEWIVGGTDPQCGSSQ
jgi:hypothetical protein